MVIMAKWCYLWVHDVDDNVMKDGSHAQADRLRKTCSLGLKYSSLMWEIQVIVH